MRQSLLCPALCLVVLVAACGDDSQPVDSADAAVDVTSDAGTDTAPTADASGDTDAGSDAAPTSGDPALDVLHAEVLSGCGGLLCHLDGQDQGDLNLDLDAGLMDRLLAPSSVDGLNLVEPGDPDTSYLYLKLTDQFRELGGTGSRMPLGTGGLPSRDIEAVAAWIESL